MNILLTFFSNVILKDDNYIKVTYSELDKDKIGETYTTNESGLRYVLQSLEEGEKLDAYVALVSRDVREKIPSEKLGKTHLELIKDRFDKIFSQEYYREKIPKGDILKTIDYNEYGSTEESIKTVVEAIDWIDNLRLAAHGEKINLYVDISGGLRDANMILLITSRILEYMEDIRVKNIIYSKLSDRTHGTIEGRKKIFDLLSLVAGVEEFVNFGSVRSLENYLVTVKNDITPEIASIIKAMKSFSEKIQLCRSTDFNKAIDELDKALKCFEKCKRNKVEQDKNMTEKMFAKLYMRINEKYRKLFAEGQSESDRKVSQIRWCLENNYLQQAMTLITEQGPEVLFDPEKQLISFVDKSKENEIREKYELEEGNKKKDKLSFETWLMFRYTYTDKDTSFEEERKKIIDEIAKISKKATFNKEDCNVYIEQLVDLHEREHDAKKQQDNKHKSDKNSLYGNIQQVNKKVNGIIKNSFLSIVVQGKYETIDYDQIRANLKEIEEKARWLGSLDREALLENLKLFSEWFKNQETDCSKKIPLMENIAKLSLDERKKYLKDLQSKTDASHKDYNGSYGEMLGIPFKAYPSNSASMLNMVRDGVLKCKSEKIIVSYYEIKDERNATNHANINRSDSTDYQELKSRIENFIAKLE